jgi:hypothetical protein
LLFFCFDFCPWVEVCASLELCAWFEAADGSELRVPLDVVAAAPIAPNARLAVITVMKNR